VNHYKFIYIFTTHCFAKRLLATLFTLFPSLRSSICSIGYPLHSFSWLTVVNTLYWLPSSLFFLAYDRQYALLATLFTLFPGLRLSIRSIGYPLHSFSWLTVVNTLYWLPSSLFFLAYGRQYALLATLFTLFPGLWSSISFRGKRAPRGEINILFPPKFLYSGELKKGLQKVSYLTFWTALFVTPFTQFLYTCWYPCFSSSA
jgi:hypothetical protein